MKKNEEINKKVAKVFRLDSEVRSRDLSVFHSVSGNEDVSAVSLHFRDGNLDREYRDLTDRFFGTYVLWAFVIFVFIVSVQLITLKKSVKLVLVVHITLLIFILILSL